MIIEDKELLKDFKITVRANNKTINVKPDKIILKDNKLSFYYNESCEGSMILFEEEFNRLKGRIISEKRIKTLDKL